MEVEAPPFPPPDLKCEFEKSQEAEKCMEIGELTKRTSEQIGWLLLKTTKTLWRSSQVEEAEKETGESSGGWISWKKKWNWTN